MPYHRLKVYQKSYELALELHKITLRFPKIEQYELASQLRRSSKSIPANIAGYGWNFQRILDTLLKRITTI